MDSSQVSQEYVEFVALCLKFVFIQRVFFIDFGLIVEFGCYFNNIGKVLFYTWFRVIGNDFGFADSFTSLNELKFFARNFSALKFINRSIGFGFILKLNPGSSNPILFS